MCDEKSHISTALIANRTFAAPGSLKEEIRYIAQFF